MNAVIRGRQAVWGIVTESGDTYAAGIVKSQKKANNSDTDEVFDNEGFAIAQVHYNMNNECDVEVICEAGTTEPDNGDDIQIVGVDCICQNSSVNWEWKGWKSLQIKAKKFANLVP